MKKTFKLTREKIVIDGVKLYRIVATENMPLHNVTKGDLGGFISSIDNLCGNAWVSGEARVYGEARVSGEARLYSNA
jgi:hypothetical protein